MKTPRSTKGQALCWKDTSWGNGPREGRAQRNTYFMGRLESEPSLREIRRIKQESRGGRKAMLDRGDSAGKHGVTRMADMCGTREGRAVGNTEAAARQEGPLEPRVVSQRVSTLTGGSRQPAVVCQAHQYGLKRILDEDTSLASSSSPGHSSPSPSTRRGP